jgi:hypothetical protein
VLPARLDDEYRLGQDPHRYGIGNAALQGRRALRPSSSRPRDLGQMGESWRGVLLDQLRRRGANFFGV